MDLLSPITFGSMRLHKLPQKQAIDLIVYALELGVTSFHVSAEYESWPFFIEAWKIAGASNHPVQIVAKIASPHYGETSFDPQIFVQKIDSYRKALDVDTITVVQWLLRYDLKQEAERQQIFKRDALVVERTSDTLKQQKKIRELVSFPYSREVALLSLEATWCDGLALYCNSFEPELLDLFAFARERRKGVLAIRPFAAGKVFENGGTIEQAVRFALSYPSSRTVVASFSRRDRLECAVAAAAAVIESRTPVGK